MPTQLRNTTRTARKQHACQLCGGTIAAGDMYRVSTNVFDGRVYDFRECPPCVSDRVLSRVCADFGYPDEGVTAEDTWDWAHEELVGAAFRAPDSVTAARRLLARVGCTCERCHPYDDTQEANT